jgi:dimethylhistidine N-methyltransferase
MKPTPHLAVRRPADPFAGDELLAGLRAAHKTLPCKLLYDERGAALFEQICTLDEYYPYRSELALLERDLPAIADAIGPAARIIEPGSGAGQKTRMLLRQLDRPATYVPIDVSAAQLVHTADALRAEFPDLVVAPIAGDYTQPLELPAASRAPGRTAVFFPGSTIGNFEPDEARRFLARFATLAGPGALLVLGADANQDADQLLRAYDDAQGVTAAFNLNLLAHLNRTRGANFDLAAFMHRAVWDPVRSRIEMHLVSRKKQTVAIAGESVGFERGEAIVTEHCYKYPPAFLASLLASAGWSVQATFVDPADRMRLWLASHA